MLYDLRRYPREPPGISFAVAVNLDAGGQRGCHFLPIKRPRKQTLGLQEPESHLAGHKYPPLLGLDVKITELTLWDLSNLVRL